ncbi:replication factor C subunit 4 [Exophiala dermatitidis]|uniref:CFEM domain-containing protein n=1 Tax=Exophiala dermatitidis TaxID=5970 RepID=A0AAN6EVX7_EXODE|nr:replication factor C subunit 4 [Exophiala dermatitidis]KAJ4525506.1 replication factor C subunit 4 [Exophiala dermatitidis]KAJ4536823.1 replication factor C subunit 4 [Exophiala dermatitidis]KAJ4555575.1 replication factor C subunit 4 [Exophiala dermatitidis]KAJ4568879.1 replication factor C subunit 4 [Exophiala dermatitidis]
MNMARLRLHESTSTSKSTFSIIPILLFGLIWFHLVGLTCAQDDVGQCALNCISNVTGTECNQSQWSCLCADNNWIERTNNCTIAACNVTEQENTFSAIAQICAIVGTPVTIGPEATVPVSSSDALFSTVAIVPPTQSSLPPVITSTTQSSTSGNTQPSSSTSSQVTTTGSGSLTSSSSAGTTGTSERSASPQGSSSSSTSSTASSAAVSTASSSSAASRRSGSGSPRRGTLTSTLVLCLAIVGGVVLLLMDNV